MNIVNVGYDSTNYYVIGGGKSRLLVDVGWPGTLGKLLANLKRKGIAIEEIKYLLATHYHPDHAGLVQEVKSKGVRLMVVEGQDGFIAAFEAVDETGDALRGHRSARQHGGDAGGEPRVSREARTSRARSSRRRGIPTTVSR